MPRFRRKVALQQTTLRRAVAPVNYLENLEARCLLAAGPLPQHQREGRTLLGDVVELQRPTVAATRPTNNETNVSRKAFIGVDVNLPNGTGIDSSTVGPQSVRLVRVSDGQVIEGNSNTSGGGDAIVFTPLDRLEANTRYRFEITAQLKDLAGAAFVPFSMSFTTGTRGGPGESDIAFEKEVQDSAQGRQFTAVTIGPDNRLYAGTLLGEIFRFRINSDGSLGQAEPINTLQNKEGGPRLLTGLEFDPASTAQNPILWVTHNAFVFENAPDFTGKITRLSGANLGTIRDVVTGLPRAVLNHATNQMDFGPDGALYVHQGSNSAMGAADPVWGRRNEHMLNAAVLRVDTTAIKGTLNVRTVDAGGSYNPFAKNPPVTLYATGIRNAYDLIWHSNGHLYVPTNGSAAGGNTPATPANINCSNRIDFDANGAYTGPQVPKIDKVTQTQPDLLFDVRRGGYYGHPNPSRCEFVMNGGNPTSGKDNLEVSQYPIGTQPDRNYRGAAFNFGFNQSPNGVIEYQSNHFGGALKGRLLVVQYSGGDDIIVLTPKADGTIDSTANDGDIAGFSQFHDPLDLIEDTRTGFIYVAEFGGNQITLLRPVQSGARIRPDKNSMKFNDAQGGSAGAARSITITNTGTQPLAIPGDGLRLTGADAKLFNITNRPEGPVLINPGDSLTLNLTFAATSVGIRTATLRIDSNDAATPLLDIPLRGLGTKGTGGLNEPSLQRILDLYQIPVNVGDSTPDETLLNNPPVSPNDEILLPRMVKAGPGRVTIDVLSVFGVDSAPAVRFGWYRPGSPDNQNQLLTVDKAFAQAVMPPLNGTNRFDPGANPFGLYTIWPGFSNRGVYSEDALNTWEPDATARHKVRFYPLKEEDGTLVPNAYVVAFEEFLKSSTDFQDFVAIIRNVKPADPSPEIGVQNLDGVPFPDRVVFNRIRDLDPNFPNGFHDTATVRVFNSGSQDLNVSRVDLNGPWRIDSGPSANFTIAGGSFADIKLRFTADAGDIHNGSLRLHSNDPDEPITNIELSGFWQQRSEGGFGSEPDLLEMIRIFGYGTTIQGAGQKLSNGGRIQKVGDEILSPYWRLADPSSPVTVRQLAAFHTQGAVAATFWHAKGSNSTTAIVRHAGSDGQAFLPRLNGDLSKPAFGSFMPSGVFGFKIDSEWSDPSKNPLPPENPADEGHHVRFWPARDRDGIVIPDTYLMAMDYSGINYDYNDNVFVVTNIRPEVDQLPIPTLSLGDAAGGRITLNWTNDSNLETGFKIERAPSVGGSPGAFTEIAQVGANATAYNDNTVQSGQTYYYRVRATSGGGDSPYSNTIAVAANDGPQKLAATTPNAGGVRLTWQDLNIEVAYKIERADTPDGPWLQIGTTGPNQNTYIDQNVTAGVEYFYRVRATKPDGGDTGYSATVSATPQPPDQGDLPVEIPGNVAAVALDDDRIRVTWTDTNNNETGYQVERSRDGVNWTSAGNLGPNQTGFTDSNLAPDTRYHYRVRAVRNALLGTFSTPVDATTAKVSTPAPTLRGRDIGSPKRTGSAKAVGGGRGYNITGGGRDINRNTDQFRFASASQNGNFDVKVRVNSLTKTNAWTKAGIMLRDGLKANARNFFVFTTPGTKGVRFSYRSANGGRTTMPKGAKAQFPNTWLRLRRAGNSFTAYRSNDGKSWNAMGSIKFKMPPKVELGLAVTSHNAKKLAKARFRDFGVA